MKQLNEKRHYFLCVFIKSVLFFVYITSCYFCYNFFSQVSLVKFLFFYITIFCPLGWIIVFIATKLLCKHKKVTGAINNFITKLCIRTIIGILFFLVILFVTKNIEIDILSLVIYLQKKFPELIWCICLSLFYLIFFYIHISYIKVSNLFPYTTIEKIIMKLSYFIILLISSFLILSLLIELHKVMYVIPKHLILTEKNFDCFIYYYKEWCSYFSKRYLTINKIALAGFLVYWSTFFWINFTEKTRPPVKRVYQTISICINIVFFFLTSYIVLILSS